MVYQLSLDQENKEITNRYKNLLQGTYQKLSKKDINLIRKAFDLALDAHNKQRRKSGEPYIFHPIAVAKIVAYQIGLGAESIAAALLHDIVEDTNYTLRDIEEYFGQNIAVIVDGLTKISRLNKEQNISIQAENYRKLLLTLNKDARVILIKIADRLHNMQTMDAMSSEKQMKIASETLYIYAPLAHRLGLYNIKNDLEDLGLKYTKPSIYKEIQQKISSSKEQQELYIKYFSKCISEILTKEKIKFNIIGRPKSIYSIHRKMTKQGIDFEQVYDKFAIRIIYKSSLKDEKLSAWKIYTAITNDYNPNPLRIRDWITQPKNTSYEALHITVMGPLGRWVEIQIRSDRMDEIAEKGYAAHFRYKQSNSHSSSLELWLDKLKEALENKSLNAVDFVENFKLNLFTEEIFVFTPKGDIKSLPINSCALDFAFAIHTDVGLHCQSVKINGKIKAIDTVLKSGDQIEVIVSKVYKVSDKWLDMVITTKAKTSIRDILKIRKKEIAEQGEIILKRKLKRVKINFSNKILNEITQHFKFNSPFDLFYRVGNGNIDNTAIRGFIQKRNNTFLNFFKRDSKKNASSKQEITNHYDLLVFGKNEEQRDCVLAQCCKPIAGDKIFGFVSKKGIKVHQISCLNALHMQSNHAHRIINAKWIDSSQQEFRVIIEISGYDRKNVLNELTTTIGNVTQANIYNIHIDTYQNLFEGKISVGIHNIKYLQNIIKNISKIKGIEKVKRLNLSKIKGIEKVKRLN